MPLIRPFKGLRPAHGRCADVIAPPYDVVSTEEARALAQGKPWSFLHISKPEIDLAADMDPYAPEVYARGRQNLDRMVQEGVLKRDEGPCYYAYRMRMGDHAQTGLVAAASIADYDSNRIRKHEHTQPDKENDRVRQIDALNAQTGPVLMAYPSAPHVDELLSRCTQSEPAAEALADDGVRHSLWRISDPAAQQALSQAFDVMPAIYIADGHHRSAAASRVAEARRTSNPHRHGNEGYESFLAVIFPHHQMQILDYNRVVTDLHGMDKATFLARLRTSFTIIESDEAVKPRRAGEFGMYLRGQWYGLGINSNLVPALDPIGRLDVSLLTDHLLSPVLGISDLRRDKRIQFVGGARGLEELRRRVDSGEMAVAFALHPTHMTDVMSVAEAGGIMPTKSTWFEPKLADGMVSHVLD